MFLVPSDMFFLRWKNHEIIGAVVMLVSVNMVNDLSLSKRPSKHLFSNSSMLMHPMVFGISFLRTLSFVDLFSASNAFSFFRRPSARGVHWIIADIEVVHSPAGKLLAAMPRAKNVLSNLRLVSVELLRADLAFYKYLSH